VIINMAPSAAVAAQGILIQLEADGDDMNLTYDSDGGTVDFAGVNAVANINLIGVGDDEPEVSIHGTATAYLGGQSYTALAYERANVEVTGSGLACLAVEVSTQLHVSLDAHKTDFLRMHHVLVIRIMQP
jgi:hypothetical protein